MATLNYSSILPNLSLDEVLVGATVQDASNSSFRLTNPANGYTIEILGNDFSYNAGTPSGGAITSTTVARADLALITS